MGLQITITHLTRMGGDRICVAGLTDDAQFIRPDCDGYLHRSDVPGLFDLGVRVDLGEVQREPSAPQVENVAFSRADAQSLGRVGETTLRDLLSASAQPTVAEILGDAVRQTQTGACYVDPGTGGASLGTLVLPPGTVDLRPDSYGSLRGRWNDEALGHLQPAVTDLRLYPMGSDHDEPVLRQLLAESKDCDELYLSVGLTKNWKKNPGHWLQLNNILPMRRPLAQVGPGVASEDWPQHGRDKYAALAERYPHVMAKYPRAWAPWNDAEDAALVEAFETGTSLRLLAGRHERKPGAIRSRLKKLDLLG